MSNAAREAELITAPSAEVADWSREQVSPWEWSPSRQLLRAVRAYQALAGRRDPYALARRSVAVAEHRFWSAVCGADIPLNSKIAGGLVIPHPNGIVVHPGAEIGPNCLIFQQVTIGAGGKIPGVPKIGTHVDIGAGAKILGGVTVGDYAKIGANAVVLIDVPSGATAAGVPAKIIGQGAP